MKPTKAWVITTLCVSFLLTGRGLSWADVSQPSDWLSTMMDNIHSGIQGVQDRLNQMYASSEDAQQAAADERDRVQQHLEDEQEKMQDIRTQMEIEKDRQETLKQQQQDLIQNLKDKAH